MENLLEVIANLRDRDAPATELFNAFTGRIREQFGACAVSLICTEGMAEDGFRVLTFIDEHGNRIIDDLDFSTPPDPANEGLSKNRETILDTTRPVIRRGTRPGIDPMFHSLFKAYIDVVSLPLVQHDGVHRWLLLLFTASGQVNKVDIERSLELSTLAINYVFSIENARRLAEANAWIKNELESVGRIQQLLLPQNLDNTPGIRVARFFQPYADVGGDYYEIAPLGSVLRTNHKNGDPETWGLMIADASGHGAAAAVEIAMFDAILRTYKPPAEEFSGPGNVLTYANHYFFTRKLRGGFITAFVSNYDPVERTLSYANAGHPPPFIRKKCSEQLLFLESRAGFPLGIDKQTQWESASIPMNRGDLLIMFTDGITEARSPSGEEFGIERLKAFVLDAPDNADACLATIREALLAHQGGMPVNDDQTLLIIEVID